MGRLKTFVNPRHGWFLSAVPALTRTQTVWLSAAGRICLGKQTGALDVCGTIKTLSIQAGIVQTGAISLVMGCGCLVKCSHLQSVCSFLSSDFFPDCYYLDRGLPVASKLILWPQISTLICCTANSRRPFI